MTPDPRPNSEGSSSFQLIPILSTKMIPASAARSGTRQVSGPVASVFGTRASSGRAKEWRVSFETTEARYPELMSHLIANHGLEAHIESPAAATPGVGR